MHSPSCSFLFLHASFVVGWLEALDSALTSCTAVMWCKPCRQLAALHWTDEGELADWGDWQLWPPIAEAQWDPDIYCQNCDYREKLWKFRPGPDSFLVKGARSELCWVLGHPIPTRLRSNCLWIDLRTEPGRDQNRGFSGVLVFPKTSRL